MSAENPTIYELPPLGLRSPSLLDELEGQGATNGDSFKYTNRQLLSAYNGPNVYNFVSDFGANASFTSVCGALLKNALENLPDDCTLVIPAGRYDCRDLTSDIIINATNITILGFGRPFLWLSYNILLDSLASEFTSYNVIYYGKGVGVTAADNSYTRLWFEANKFESITSATPATTVYGLNLGSSNISSLRLVNNDFSGITSTGAGTAYGAIIGANPSGNTFNSATDYFINGNKFDSITTSATDNTGLAVGLQAYGRMVRVSNNYFRNISHNSVNTSNYTTCGLNIWGHEVIASANNFEAGGRHESIRIQGGNATSGQPPGRVLVTNNTFSAGGQQSIRQIYVEGASTLGAKNIIKDNIFVDPNCVGNGVIEVTGGVSHVEVSGNTITGGNYYSGVHATGGDTQIKHNTLSHVHGPLTSSSTWAGISFVPTASSSNVAIEDNEIHLTSWNNNATNAYGINVIDNSFNLSNVGVRRNKLIGVTSGATAWSTTRWLTTAGRTHSNIVFEDNENDAAVGVVDLPVLYNSLSVAAGQTLVGLFANTYPVTSATYDLPASYSGLVLTNDGATDVTQINLPLAIPGVEFTFMRVDNELMRVHPAGTEIIQDGGPGKYLQLDGRGVITLVCYEINSWFIVHDAVLYTYEA